MMRSLFSRYFILSLPHTLSFCRSPLSQRQPTGCGARHPAGGRGWPGVPGETLLPGPEEESAGTRSRFERCSPCQALPEGSGCRETGHHQALPETGNAGCFWVSFRFFSPFCFASLFFPVILSELLFSFFSVLRSRFPRAPPA